MSFGQGGEPQWDPWKPGSQQQQWGAQSGGTPDWAALAEASESRNKRRRLLMIGGGALATLAVGAAVAVAVVSADGDAEASNKNGGDRPVSADIPSASDGPEPSFAPTSAPPPLDPMDFITSAEKDTAPISPESLFPGTRLTMGETVYQKGLTASTTECASAAQGTLPQALTANDCTRLMRVTYSKDGIAVTVGVALFDTEAQAAKARQAVGAKPIVTSLPGDGVPSFCRTTVCRQTTNSYGRYAYFTNAGFTDGRKVTQQDTAVFTAGDDLQEFTFRQIRRRGEAQASAATNE